MPGGAWQRKSEILSERQETTLEITPFFIVSFFTIHMSIYWPQKVEYKQRVQLQHQKKAVDGALSVPVTDATTAFELQEIKRLATEKGWRYEISLLTKLAYKNHQKRFYYNDTQQGLHLNHLHCISRMLNKREKINNVSVRNSAGGAEWVGKLGNIWIDPEQGTAKQMVSLRTVKHDLQPANSWVKTSNCYSEKIK